MLVALASGHANGARDNEAFESSTQRIRYLVICGQRIVLLVFFWYEIRIIVYRMDNRQQVIIGFIRNYRSTEYFLRTDIVIRSRQVDDEIPREQIIICSGMNMLAKGVAVYPT